MRQTISVQGARENNLKNINVEIPRDKLVVLTGLSGSGKSSLAFETIYAEGQRRFLESLSAYSRKYVAQLQKPKVDAIYGLSPVISIEQKSVSRNPRSTVGTMTDIYDYLRVLFTTAGTAHCPHCRTEVPTRTPVQIAEHILALPVGTLVEIDAPIFKIYGEDYPYLFGEIRTKGYRRLRIDDELVDLSEALEVDETLTYEMEAVIDKFVVKPDLFKPLVVAIENGLRVGEGFLRLRILTPVQGGTDAFFAGFTCPEHQIIGGELEPVYFSFNEPVGACPTCTGLGMYWYVQPELLVLDKTKSLRGGALEPKAFHYDKDSWAGRMMHSMAAHYGFSLDTPWQDLPAAAHQVIMQGSGMEKITILQPPGSSPSHSHHIGKSFPYEGIVGEIERRYRRYRRDKTANAWVEEYMKRVMVERTCPDCRGRQLKPQRLLSTIGGKNIMELGDLTLSELRDFFANLAPFKRNPQAGAEIGREISKRLDLLIEIGIEYLSLNRRSTTLSGGESQRVRLSVQIGSELMGMLYVLDEPSIGLHPRDNRKMIYTLQRLRDQGNTVIVVEHDEETMRAADHIIEIGPGPGQYGGEVVAQGPLTQLIQQGTSLTGQFLSGQRSIPLPQQYRPRTEQRLIVHCATENNLKRIDVAIPLGLLVCITGVSGSGKSTLINEILFKQLQVALYASRILPGAHERIEGLEHIQAVIDIDQTPIGRTPTSNPATYVGLFDPIRALFVATEESQRRGYAAGRFSFNTKGGRCEECRGQGMIVTSLQFMADVEVLCHACKGARYNEETLEITYKGKNIAQVLDLSIEEAVQFFHASPLLAHKLRVLAQLGLGYLKLGQSSTTISGGEAQRIKLAHELGKIKRGGRTLYILDEPTTGLHLADIQRLLDALNQLVDAGNSVLVIEHHLDVIKSADWVIDLGPEGGKQGGYIVAQGPPEMIAQCEQSYTGQYLRKVLAHLNQQG
ncbi:MAG: excinuclease ABC subunit UvrA [Caldilineaceae bacterium]|nr:excinuclease ABC subunit UvrA [Caldilineaceae bacterium]